MTVRSDLKELTVCVYDSRSPVRFPLKLFRAMLKDLLASRYLAWRLLIRNTKAQYRQAILGIFWAFIPPVLSTVIFVGLYSQNILHVGEVRTPYPVYVLVGTLLWQSFVEALNAPMRQITSSTSMLDKLNFPREALILTGFGEVIFTLCIRGILVFIVFAFFKIEVTPSVFLVPLGILALVLFGLTVGIFLVPLGLLFKDVERGLGVLVTAWFFMTPVVYPMSKTTSPWIQFNPVAHLLNTTREWWVGDPASATVPFCVISILTLAALAMAWMVCRVAMPHLIQRLSS